MRRITAVLLFASVSLCTGCSYVTDFAVVNNSNQPIEVRYKFKFNLPVPPATVPALSQVSKGWQELPATQYVVNPESRTVVMHLKPGEALLIDRALRAGMRDDEVDEARYFGIEEIVLVGAHGEIHLKGEQARKLFAEVSRELYILTYN